MDGLLGVVTNIIWNSVPKSSSGQPGRFSQERKKGRNKKEDT